MRSARKCPVRHSPRCSGLGSTVLLGYRTSLQRLKLQVRSRRSSPGPSGKWIVTTQTDPASPVPSMGSEGGPEWVQRVCAPGDRAFLLVEAHGLRDALGASGPRPPSFAVSNA